VELGASPRGSLALYRASQAHAAIQGRSYVLPDDVKRLVHPVLAHRLIATSQMRLRGRQMEQVIDDILDSVEVPVER
jgi:MoxR-like ATPase